MLHGKLLYEKHKFVVSLPKTIAETQRFPYLLLPWVSLVYKKDDKHKQYISWL